MKKNIYLRPEATVATMELQQINAVSGGDATNQVNVTSTPDNSDGSITNRSRGYNVWDNEDDDEEEQVD